MHSVNWHKALLLFLWITPHLLLGVVAVILYRRRLYREFRCFFAYVLCEIVGFFVLFTVYSTLGTGKVYAYTFCARLLLDIALRFGVIDEVTKNLFRESQSLRVIARRSLQAIVALLLVAGVLLAIYAPGDNSARWIPGLSVINRGAAMAQCGMLLSLLFFSRFLGVSWRRHAFGITLGLGVLTSMDLATSAIRAEFPRAHWISFFDLLSTAMYLVCVSIWIGYLLSPEVNPVVVAALPRDEVESWKSEFQHLLRD